MTAPAKRLDVRLPDGTRYEPGATIVVPIQLELPTTGSDGARHLVHAMPLDPMSLLAPCGRTIPHFTAGMRVVEAMSGNPKWINCVGCVEASRRRYAL